MGKFSGILLCSDIDGTFTIGKKTIKKNIDAVIYFIRNGGYFTIATGRTVSYLQNMNFFPLINAPVCACNGSVVYSYRDKMILREVHNDFTLREFLEVISPVRNFISGLYVYFDPMTIQAPNSINYEFTPDELNQTPLKLVCVSDDAMCCDKLKQFCARNPLFTNTFISKSWDTGLEFNNINGTKESALRTITNSIPGFNYLSVAVGDYENDIPMFEAASIFNNARLGFAVENALPEVKAAAYRTVCNVEKGAIAEVVDIIEKWVDSGALSEIEDDAYSIYACEVGGPL